MKTLQELITDYLPADLKAKIEDLNNRIEAHQKPAGEFLSTNPDAGGLPVSTTLEWANAVAIVSFAQRWEDQLIQTESAKERRWLKQLYLRSLNAIDSFADKYGNVASNMRAQNFIKDFLFLGRIKFADIDSATICWSYNRESLEHISQIETAFEDPNWLVVRDADPDYFNDIKNCTSSALAWAERDDTGVIIVPVEILGEFHALCNLGRTIELAQKDIESLAEDSEAPEILCALVSILEENIVELKSRLQRHKVPFDHIDPVQSVLQVAENNSGIPADIVERFGPGCLCAPWAFAGNSSLSSTIQNEGL